MKIIFVKFTIALIIVLFSAIQHPAVGQKNVLGRYEPPHLENRHGALQLIVSGKPFTLVSGELHNSTSSTREYFDDALKNAKGMNLNSVIATISWEQFEPEENHFDFSLLDHLIQQVHDNKLKLVLLWLASWKNGESSYMPVWAKRDTRRFFRVKDQHGKDMSAVSPFCTNAMEADAKAFAVLMERIKAKDRYSEVVMVQVENEVGAFSDIDHGKQAQLLYQSPVPVKLVDYLKENKEQLDPYIKEAWVAKGEKQLGTWAQLFGETNLTAQHLFMSWHYAQYINEVCRRGKVAYPLPMYVNAWQDREGSLPGKYPNGGPVAKVLDIYRVAGPFIDFISPDIYLPNFREICDKYFRPQKKNPLFVPECERTNPGKAFYVLGQNDGIGFAPFGIESMVGDLSYAQSNAVLNELLPLITSYQGTNRMRAFIQQGDEDTTIVDLGAYRMTVSYTSKEKKSFGLIIQTADQQYLIVGLDCRITFSSLRGNSTAHIGQILEGGFQENQWYTTRQLNGDETSHNRALIVGQRNYAVTLRKEKKSISQVLAPIAILDQELEPGLQTAKIKSPAIYKVQLFDIPKI